jgi:ribosomal protein L24E
MICSFCRKNFEAPRGVTIVQKDGTPRHYCSGKCRKSSQMGRDSRKLMWVRKMPENKTEMIKREEKKLERKK